MRICDAHYLSLSWCFTFILLYLQRTRKQKSLIASANLFFLRSTTILGLFVNIVRRNVEKKKKHSWSWCLERVARVSVNTHFSAYVYSQSNILSKMISNDQSIFRGTSERLSYRLISLSSVFFRCSRREKMICSRQRILKYYFDIIKS